MPEHGLNDLHIDTGGEGERGSTVPEVVQADGRQPGLPDDLVEPRGDISRMQRTPVRLGEQQAAVDPFATEASLVRVLARDVPTQDEDSVRVERDQAFRRRGLRR
nr:hypothetical protein [Amycolatopsis japonica]